VKLSLEGVVHEMGLSIQGVVQVKLSLQGVVLEIEGTVNARSCSGETVPAESRSSDGTVNAKFVEVVLSLQGVVPETEGTVNARSCSCLSVPARSCS
jgi:hypothetical protein